MAPPSSDSRMTHADLGSPDEMFVDCQEVGRNLHLERAARAAVEIPPSIRYEDFPREIPKREIRVSDAAVRLAEALHLHLD